MELKDDDYLVIVNKILRNAYEKLKKGKIYDVEEAREFCSSYKREYIIKILETLINEKKYLKEVWNEEPTKYVNTGYAITPKGLDYLFSDSYMKELNKQY